MKETRRFAGLALLGLLPSLASCGDSAPSGAHGTAATAGTTTGGRAPEGTGNGGSGAAVGGNAGAASAGSAALAGAGGTGDVTTSSAGSAASAGVSGSGGSTGDSGGTSGAAGAAGSAPLATCPGGATPPNTWQEHWFEHAQNVKLVAYDECAAIYFDDDMDPAQKDWIFAFVSDVWKYSLATYGVMGPERVYAIFHQGKYGGGHPSYYFDASHDHHNVSDVGGGDWSAGNWDVTSHELGHVVESTASHTKYGSPAFGLWGDSKWMEFYQYDVYVGLGMTEHAQVVFDRFSGGSDSFPRAGTHWFKDWFYPLWRDHGHAQVMVRFYSLLEQYYPAQNQRMGGMNWGEYVHFTSGAAGVDLKPLATTAFGWPDEWETQLQAAKQKFSQITY